MIQQNKQDFLPHRVLYKLVNQVPEYVVLFHIVLYFVFVLMGWLLLPNALRPFRIHCGPLNLSITRT